MGVEYQAVLYIKEPPTRTVLEDLVSKLEDPVEDLVRKDSKFKKLGLDAESFVGDAEAVINILVEHKALLQRPIVVAGDKAIIGRPKTRIAELLG